jgi:hypothetical protein
LNTYLEKAEENALHHPTEEEGEEQGFTLTGGSNTKKKQRSGGKQEEMYRSTDQLNPTLLYLTSIGTARSP